MYNQPKNDSEAYLLGKEVTSVDQIEKLGQDYEESPAQRLARIDMEAKFREDPLTVMKQREAEKRMELLRNTSKVKKLRRLLTMQKHMQEKKRKQRHMDRRRGNHTRSSSSGSDSSSGDELLDKFIKIVRQSDELDAEHRKHEECSSNIESKSRRDKPPGAPRRNNQPSTSNTKPKDKPKLTRDELEARRIQMMNDAKEHAKDRSVRTSHHYQQKIEQDARDAQALSRHGASFIRQMKDDHAQRSTIEDSIHRKASSRQRGELNSNFLKR
ncbi:Pre-mRNA-splicing factor CWC25 [Fasciola hepatica]|uniref:Pre-mRNA-splicing factor CWC25 n=1 Tax=Fasciola hepatica TaxID=6192 RepID=A0A2H1BTS2_FASHE|nr:Pre-mRNA-splicing factor CWC25 [Fasciola hepatica]